jgi:pullulanase-type alpha-1,6-glucosidase
MQVRSLRLLTLALALLLVPAAFAPPAFASQLPAAPAAIGEARAHWLTRDMVAWNAPVAGPVVMLTDPGEGAAPPADAKAQTLAPAGTVSGVLAVTVPHLKGMRLYRIEGATREKVDTALRGRVRMAVRLPDGRLAGTTGLQIGGVLDDLYANDAPLGVSFAKGIPSISLWAPTARLVKLRLYDGPNEGEGRAIAMARDPATGSWRVDGAADWNRKYYRFEVSVFVPGAEQVVTNLLTDPYSLGLSAGGERSQIVNLSDADLQPEGWSALGRSLPEAPEDSAIYELHVRDFSIGDSTATSAHRGKYLAFTDMQSNGMRHLAALAGAGLTHLHLLPTFDCATVPERASEHRTIPDLSKFGPASERQQAAVAAIRASDAFNWCYDPLHFFAPDGNYASDPDGPARIREFRDMVLGLDRIGLGAVLDLVFNHTAASGQDRLSVLDRIVPGYYQRLDEKGAVATSTCCANTASERAMMERLMIDAMIVLARDYKVSGFRFDLMGHHSRSNILKVRERLSKLTLARDGVDGARLLIYGEGWNFGEVANDARFVQATQRHMGAGSGVGTFNDRFRDAIRGGSYSDTGEAIVRSQAFASGLFTAPNALNKGSAAERSTLLKMSDHLRAGLAGSIRSFVITDQGGVERRLEDLVYGGGDPVGYVSDPQETINYAEAHDNETLFDLNAYKLPRQITPSDRMRAQNLATSLVLLAQGVPFLHAGQDLLRSKSLDRNSFDSGDWFNHLDFSMRGNGWGRGLPPKWDNAASWPVQRGLLADRRIDVGPAQIRGAAAHAREMLAIRRSSPLFRLRTAEEIKARLHFHNVGAKQIPGLIVMSLKGDDGVEVITIFNATPRDVTFALEPGRAFKLHPIQKESADPMVRRAAYANGSFLTPARTTAVFVADTTGTGGSE